MRVFLIFILLLITATSRLFAEDAIPLAPDFTLRELHNDFYFFPDTSGILEYSDIQKDTSRFIFIKSTREIPYMHHLNGSVWIKFYLENQSQKSKKVLVHFDFPLYDTITMYQKDTIEVIEESLGLALPFFVRKRLNPDPLFEVYLEPQEKKEIVFKISKTTG
ncbi:MAG: hypothetical protein IPO21_08045 [Bacteroidales bacterium]|nr:hypothetical protein [Bacteroidales bacterium]